MLLGFHRSHRLYAGRTNARDRRQAGDAEAHSLERVGPHLSAGGGIETVGVALNRGDQAVAVIEQDDVSRSLGRLPRPDELARVAVERTDALVEADEDEVG